MSFGSIQLGRNLPITGYAITRIADAPELVQSAGAWFHAKWSIPEEAYLTSMQACLRGEDPVPQWYVALDNDRIIGGLGVIENDFHNRKDLTPNVCAVYVEPEYRCRGIAGELLRFVCRDMADKGIDTLYLITEHDSFYERYGWEFLCMVQGDGEDHLSRMYTHRE
ncbi:MAG: GNAT family N-acetyltransferase [Eubacteriales bacterium]|nr:GNAT family N-acetyltransferase [Eubacteriales bacterium]